MLNLKFIIEEKIHQNTHFIEKTRSISVDLNQNSSFHNKKLIYFLKGNSGGGSKKEAKQIIPKLRLEAIPTYHGHNKTNKPLSQYQIPISKNDIGT